MARSVTVIPASRTREGACEGRPAKPLRVAAYCRVSTDHEEQLGSFANQVEHYTQAIRSDPGYVLAGIYADEGISGTGTKKREGFRRLIRDCQDGKIDRVITKSISRFARNTADCLHYARQLKALGIGIQFEKENIFTLDSAGELLFTILSSLAQEESRSISENTAWGIRSRFRKGIPHINTNQLLGYDKNQAGELVVNEAQAQTVRRIFRELLEGWRPAEIAARLNADEVPGVHGKARWYPVTVQRMLKNEKYQGDLLMQKTYTESFLTKRQAANAGELEQYFVQDDHEAIVERDVWSAAQLELERLAEFRRSHRVQELSSCTGNRFAARVFCAACGKKYQRHAGKSAPNAFWRCQNSEKKNGGSCPNQNIREQALGRAVLLAWNSLVAQRERHLPRWQQMLEQGNALERWHAKNMIEITADGPLGFELPELTRLLLAEIAVLDAQRARVCFVDGSIQEVEL